MKGTDQKSGSAVGTTLQGSSRPGAERRFARRGCGLVPCLVLFATIPHRAENFYLTSGHLDGLPAKWINPEGGGLLLAVFLLRFALGPVSYAATTSGGLYAPMLVLGAQIGLLFGIVQHSRFTF